MARKLKAMHPGEVLREEFLILLKLSAGSLASICAALAQSAEMTMTFRSRSAI